MKIPQKSHWSRSQILFATMLAWSTFAQQSPSGDSAATAGPYDFSSPAGPHHRVIETMVADHDAQGKPIQRLSRYTEVATGLNYLDDNGAWQTSVEQIKPHPEGAAALAGYYKAVWKHNLNQSGAIKLITPDGREIKNHPLGLYYVDRTSGNWVKLSGIKDSVGQIVGNNQVLYSNVGDSLKMDLRYIYQKGQFHADWILRECPPPAETYGLSGDSSLEVITEFIDVPEPALQQQVLKQEVDPVRRGAMIEPDITDVTLDFGGLQLIQGQAYPLGQGGREMVTKQWLREGARRFLSERLESKALAALAAQLPVATSIGQVAQSGRRTWPDTPPPASEGMPMQQTPSRGGLDGVVLDYYTPVTGGNYTGYLFSSGTYYISGQVNISAGTCSFSPGAVLKFPPTDGDLLVYGGAVISGSGATLTCSADNSIGAVIDGSSGIPSRVSGPGLWLYFDTVNETVSGLNFRWLATALRASASSSPSVFHTISGCSFSNCDRGVWVDTSSNPRVDVISPTFCNVTAAYTGTPTHSGDVANNQPTISGISNQTINENSSQTFGPFTIGDSETPANSLAFSATSSDPSLVSSDRIYGYGTGTTRFVSLSPNTDRFGACTIITTVTDGSGCEATSSFTLTVNSRPIVYSPSARVTTVDLQTAVIGFTIGDPDSSVDSIAMSATFDPTKIQNATFGGSGSGRTVQLTPVQGATGVTRITITATDSGGASGSSSFDLTIVPDPSDPDNHSFRVGRPGDILSPGAGSAGGGTGAVGPCLLPDLGQFEQSAYLPDTCNVLPEDVSAAPDFEVKNPFSAPFGGSGNCEYHLHLTLKANMRDTGFSDSASVGSTIDRGLTLISSGYSPEQCQESLFWSDQGK